MPLDVEDASALTTKTRTRTSRDVDGSDDDAEWGRKAQVLKRGHTRFVFALYTAS
jgi:hypothetical protein